MNKTSILAIIVIIIIVAIGAAFAAMHHGPTSATSSPASTAASHTSTSSSATTQLAGVRIYGSGATFPAAQYDVWFSEFRKETGIDVEYRPVGSGRGVQDFIQGLVDFAGSDPPLPHNIWLRAKEKYGGVLQAPTIAGAIVVVYNIPGVKVHLNLTGDVLAKIYMGEIRYWDDPAIQKLNPGVKLPHKEIVPVYRSDSSGTTQYFTYYLTLSNKEWAEKYGYGKVWKVQGVGIGATGNPGVAAAVKNTPYSIGYVEYAYALRYNLSIAALAPPGRSDIFLLPSVESIQKTLAKVAEKLPSPDADWSNTFGLSIKAASEVGGYPLTAYTHIVLRKKYNDPKKCEALKMLLEWIYKANIEKKYIVKGYVPLPKPMAEKLLEAAKLLCKP